MRSDIPKDVWYTGTLNSDTSGSWIDVANALPFEGVPVEVMLKGGSASGSAGSLVVYIEASADASAVAETLWSKSYVLAVAANASDFKDIIRNITTKYRYVRARFDFTGTIDGDVTAYVGVVTGRIG
jgi:hypothetical protein